MVFGIRLSSGVAEGKEVFVIKEGNMKRSLAKALSVLLALVVAIGISGSFTLQAAAADYFIFLDETLYTGVETGFGASENVMNRIVSVRTSNSKVAKIEIAKGSKKSNIFSYTVVPKKTGKVTIKVRYKNKAGEIKVKTFKRRVKPYPNMVKKLTVNGKAVTVSKSANAVNYYKDGFGKKKTSAKIALKPASGWKVDSVYGYLYRYDPWKSKEITVTKKMVTGRDTISFPKKYNDLDVHITLINEKGATIEYNVEFVR